MVPCKVSCGDRDRLDREFSKEELFAASSSMQNGKSRGMDGLPCEFYKVMWDTTGDDFCSLASEDFASGRLSEILNQGLINLIPKNAAMDSIGGWRLSPCSLLLIKLWPRLWHCSSAWWQSMWLVRSRQDLFRGDSFFTMWFLPRRLWSGQGRLGSSL